MAIKIGLDAGHGLKTAGKQTPDGIKEWTLNDKVRDKVVSILSDYDVEIIHTDNDEGQTDESLSYRVNKYINAGVSAFVSIHHNAYTGNWNNATGVEIYTDINATSEDTRLANCIYSRLPKYTGLKGRGVKKANWYVINQNKIPAVLVEGGFMDGTNDYKIITSDAGQTAYAKAVAEGLIEFLGLKKKTSSTTSSTTSELYRVRKTWADASSQIGAYSSLDNAKAACKDGYSVFDSKGNVVYTKTVLSTSNTVSNTPSSPKTLTVNATYKVYAGGRWYSEVKNLEDYAGDAKNAIRAIAIKVDNGSVKYRVHVKGGNWYPYVTGYNSADGNNGYAGDCKNDIDMVEVYYTTPSGYVSKKAKYRVAPVGMNYYSWQYDNEKTNGQDGYAGNKGVSLGKFQLVIE